ncbi:MAG: GTP-binding protein [Bacillota bacterium]|nr:GTP-binding protein [Bacillota bacterium]
MVKFDIVSGFLGAGKTTFIKKVLESLDNQEEKLVLIENEFGDVNVDREFLKVSGFEVYELSNGCVCCKLKGDFLLTLKHILSQKVDRIIFEPSGIFILSEIVDLFKDFEISSKCYINTVTTIVDAENFSKHIQSYSYFFSNQISNASTLILSKTQFLKTEDIDVIRETLHGLNEKAVILTKNWTDLSPQEILDIIEKEPAGTINGDSTTLGHDFETLGIRTSIILEVNQLKSILEKCKAGRYGTILRGKGIINSGNKFLEFQYVDGHYTISESNDHLVGIVSFIGKNLEKQTLKEAFQ